MFKSVFTKYMTSFALLIAMSGIHGFDDDDELFHFVEKGDHAQSGGKRFDFDGNVCIH